MTCPVGRLAEEVSSVNRMSELAAPSIPGDGLRLNQILTKPERPVDYPLEHFKGPLFGGSGDEGILVG